ncbi:hypothetical protein G6L37_32440 [Agrobacterium rubi]|uniref:hypothetical protein n=1 Tax=Agrobacterium rubi TaxID=28099 RepID=UPI0015731796|nr:hypothetical protein [Agrobacterium rubi]NTF10707.1 hypothetical protein [Agrobacterium rubi]NTF23101.1 hypothetical protein [Agrobacterium rubi]NTF30032.1 hypothetical protein [Agrobacterium rubi]
MGVESLEDKTIDIRVVSSTFDGAGSIADLTGIYGGLQQLRVSIPPEITKLTEPPMIWWLGN